MNTENTQISAGAMNNERYAYLPAGYGAGIPQPRGHFKGMYHTKPDEVGDMIFDMLGLSKAKYDRLFSGGSAVWKSRMAIDDALDGPVVWTLEAGNTLLVQTGEKKGRVVHYRVADTPWFYRVVSRDGTDTEVAVVQFIDNEQPN